MGITGWYGQWAGRTQEAGRLVPSVHCSAHSQQKQKTTLGSGSRQSSALPCQITVELKKCRKTGFEVENRKKCGSVEPRVAAAAALMATRAIDPIGHTQDTPHRDRCRGKSKESLRNTSGKLTSKSPKSTPESDTRLNAA